MVGINITFGTTTIHGIVLNPVRLTVYPASEHWHDGDFFRSLYPIVNRQMSEQLKIGSVNNNNNNACNPNVGGPVFEIGTDIKRKKERKIKKEKSFVRVRPRSWDSYITLTSGACW